MHDEGGADTTFVHPALVMAEWCVLCPAPGRTDGSVSADDTWLLGVVASTRFLGATTVISEEHDHGLFFDAQLLQSRQHLANILIHAVHHCRVGGHAEILPILI